MKRIIYILLIAGIMLFAFNFCNECPIDEAPTTVCEVRDATITKFNPSLQEPTPPDTVWVPVPEYSIHTFLFPADKSNSGLMTNDSRFEEQEQIIMADEKFPNPDGSGELKAVIYDIYPFNTLMVGDLMVIRVTLDPDPLLSEAVLRFYGDLARMPQDFTSENADLFCEDYISNLDEGDINSFRDNSSQYGAALPNASVHSYDEDDILVIDNDGNVLPGVSAPASVVNDLLSVARNNAIDVIVSPGEVYFYKARNGKEFAVVIADISEGTFEPFKKRVTIMFTALR